MLDFFHEKLFGKTLANTEISSDSTSMYILVLLLFVLSLIGVLALQLSRRWKQEREPVFRFLRSVFSYFLAVELLKYGFDKLFKAQFYLPEPNILYTPIGKVSSDLLFWSSMGSSHGYNIFSGLTEIIPALLILFRRTRTFGLILATGVLVNVVAINFSFDISVKILSVFLLFLSLLGLAPHLKAITGFFFTRRVVVREAGEYLLSSPRKKILMSVLKPTVIIILFLEGSFPYLNGKNFNDDLVQRPFLHGAYQVDAIRSVAGNLPEPELSLKRFFIHRDGYIIFQDRSDEMQDFKLDIDTIGDQFVLTDYDLNTTRLKYAYHASDSTLELQYFQGHHQYFLVAKAVNWRDLPLLKNEFHWTVD